MTETDFIAPPDLLGRENGSTTWKAPSNIALIKYWGKREGQFPANPSLSITLEASATTTTLSYQKRVRPGDDFSFKVLLDHAPEPSFEPKIAAFFKRALPYLPFLKEYHFTIATGNTFPHSSGIASSASGMAALALCLTDLERLWTPGRDEAYYRHKASFLARLGSECEQKYTGPAHAMGQAHAYCCQFRFICDTLSLSRA